MLKLRLGLSEEESSDNDGVDLLPVVLTDEDKDGRLLAGACVSKGTAFLASLMRPVWGAPDTRRVKAGRPGAIGGGWLLVRR